MWLWYVLVSIYMISLVWMLVIVGRCTKDVDIKMCRFLRVISFVPVINTANVLYYLYYVATLELRRKR